MRMAKELNWHLTGQRELGDLMQKMCTDHIQDWAPHKTAKTAAIVQKYSQGEDRSDWIAAG